METPSCPPAAELADFAIGKMSSEALARIAEHVRVCSACEESLDHLDASGDPLLRELRYRAGAGTEAPPRVLAAARAARTSQGQDSWRTAPVGQRIGKFELLESLGSGSFGYVFRARDTELDRTVAVKIMRSGRLAGPDEVDRFLREARSAAQLKHPGIVGLFEAGQTPDGTYYLVEEFVQGSTVASRLQGGPLEPRQAALLIAELAEALDYAHQHGVVHRDLKPSNIMLDQEGRPHVMDFGLAKRDTEEVPTTPDGLVLGTPAYMSPEQARGDSHLVDGRSDLYSLGVILYELLTGERPFRGNRRMLILQVLEDEPRPPRLLHDKIPRDLETICLKAMAKAPTRRYATGRELADDLRRFLDGEPIKARPMGRGERVRRWCRRNPLAASVFIILMLGSAFGFWHLSWLSEQLVRFTAVEGAAQQAEMLEEVNNLYAKIAKVVETVHPELIEDGSVPLPATLTIQLGQQMQKCESGTQVRLYSDFPFRSRTNGGPQDDFERDALARLRQSPHEPVYRFEESQGRPVLRYATARIMSQSCIGCHNTHKDSVKTDWQEGDVRGVVEIIRPLERDIARTRAGLRGAILLTAIISGSLLALSGLILFMRNRRGNSSSLARGQT